MMFYMYTTTQAVNVQYYDYNGELRQIASVCTNLRQIKLAYS